MENSILFGNKKFNPYYIAAPSLTTSAGIKVLHLLCHNLNLKGYPAFLVGNVIWKENPYTTYPGLITPVIDMKTFRFHIENEQNPIVIYPEVISGNPLNAKNVVRYLLNYAGLLGGPTSFPPSDMIYSYSKKIADRFGNNPSQILFMPIFNTKIFYPPEDNQTKRAGSCFYASKYRSLGGQLFDITNDSIEITRWKSDSQTTEEVAEILRRSEVFYTYEDTSLVTESILCGCPVVFLKNQFFDGEPLAIYELGKEGCSFDLKPENIQYAKSTIIQGRQNFLKTIDIFWLQLENFIQETQTFSFEAR